MMATDVNDIHQAAGYSLSGQAGDWLSQATRDAQAGEGEEILVDLSGVERIASDQLGELIRLHLRVKQTGHRLVLSNVRSNVLEVFTLTRLDRMIELRYESSSV